jgi:CheY-like chemotaxis protein
MSSARILYLDDEEPLVFIVKRMLERLGHQVAGFTTAEAALTAFRAAPETFHLVLTDMSMPGMSGIDFAMSVLSVKSDARVVIVSGYMDPRDRERAMAAGVHDCISKPSTLDEMRDMVAAYLPPIAT